MHRKLLYLGWKTAQPIARNLVRKYDGLPEGFSPRRILAVRIQGAGDVLMTTPAVRSLRKQFPNAEIHYLVGDQAVEMLQHNPDIDRIIPISETGLFSRSLKQVLPYIRMLRRQQYDLGIIFSRSAGLHSLLTACRINFRVGFSKNGSGALLHVPVALGNGVRYEVLDYLELSRAIGGQDCGTTLQLYITSEEDVHGRKLLAAAGIDWDTPFALFSVGGGRNRGWEVPQKRWSMASFAQLADELACRVVVVGDDVDFREAEPWFRDNPSVANLCGGLSLRDTAAVLKRAKLLVTNDTVTMHMAVMMGLPTVALFGPTHPQALLPPGIKHVRFLQGKLACSPCFWQNMPGHVSNFGDSNFPGCPRARSAHPAQAKIHDSPNAISLPDDGEVSDHGQSPCLDTISVSDVTAAIGNLLSDYPEGKTFVRIRQ